MLHALLSGGLCVGDLCEELAAQSTSHYFSEKTDAVEELVSTTLAATSSGKGRTAYLQVKQTQAPATTLWAHAVSHCQTTGGGSVAQANFGQDGSKILSELEKLGQNWGQN